MSHLSLVLLAVCVWLCPHAIAAEPAKLTPSEWVAAYKKLGGQAGYDKEENHLGITQYRDEKHVDFSSLGEPTGVTTVVLHGGKVSDADLKRVMEWSRVRAVDLSDCFTVTDAGIRYIAANRKIQRVDIGDTAMTSAGINSFSGHPAVESLWLHNSNLTPSAVKCIDLDSMPALKIFVLSCPQLVSLRIADCKSLKELANLPSTLETVVLADLPELKEFDAHRTKLNKLSVSGKCGLTVLNVKKSQLTERQVNQLKAILPNATIKSDFTK